MSAEAIARLRGSVVLAGIHVATVRAADLRALLDAHAALEAAHTEALDALERAEKWMSKPLCEDGTCDGCVVRDVLAKAGRQ